jgi:methyltransferase (TIGR00027 family)
MRDGSPSATAQRVAGHRLRFDRLDAPFGDPVADERLAADVAGTIEPGAGDRMVRYLRARTAFFDRVVINALERGVTQVLAIGAGYDGRSLRYAKPSVRWFEVDHPATQADKRARLNRLAIETPQVTFASADLRDPGLAAALLQLGYEPDAPSLIVCEGVMVYLDEATLVSVFDELRATATAGTRFAFSASVSARSGPPEREQRREQFRMAVAEVGEPARSELTADDLERLLAQTRWRKVELSDRATRAGFCVAAPQWVGAHREGTPATASRIGAYLERTFDRRGTDGLAHHLEETYGISVKRMRELDVGVFGVERTDGAGWVARVFPAARPLEATVGDAEILGSLARAGFPAERPADPAPVSTLQGQSVLVTEYVRGRRPASNAHSARALGALLGRLHGLSGISERPGGGWHHLVLEGDPRDEIAAACSLLCGAEPRVGVEQAALYRRLCDELEQADDCGDLPHALIHPDFAGPNVIDSTEAGPTLVDWAGAGHGPRLWSLGFLLWATGPRHAGAVASGYRSAATVEPSELDRLEGAVVARPLVFTSWAFCTGRKSLVDVVGGLDAIRARAADVATRARAVFESAGAGAS